MDTFFWGNSVSSMQTEGGWNQGGKSLSVYDIREASDEVSDWHFANDNYNSDEGPGHEHVPLSDFLVTGCERRGRRIQ